MFHVKVELRNIHYLHYQSLKDTLENHFITIQFSTYLPNSTEVKIWIPFLPPIRKVPLSEDHDECISLGDFNVWDLLQTPDENVRQMLSGETKKSWTYIDASKNLIGYGYYLNGQQSKGILAIPIRDYTLISLSFFPNFWTPYHVWYHGDIFSVTPYHVKHDIDICEQEWNRNSRRIVSQPLLDDEIAE